MKLPVDQPILFCVLAFLAHFCVAKPVENDEVAPQVQPIPPEEGAAQPPQPEPIPDDAAAVSSSTGTETDDEKRAKAKKFVEEINGKNKGGWKAEYKERFALMDDNTKKMLAGGIRGAKPPTNSTTTEDNEALQCNGTAPAAERRRKRQITCSNTVAFDARTQWSGCAGVIGKVQDQSNCGSCWAVSTASAFSDRRCIARSQVGLASSATDANSHFSALDLLSCSPNSYGCSGGYPYYAWDWIRTNGVVTGTDYTWKSGCKPYPIAPGTSVAQTAPACTASCTNTAWPYTYTSSKKFTSATGWIQGAGQVAAIENQIRTYGTVVASMDVYNDFFYYSSGVYKHVSTSYMGGHAIRLIGWGTRTCSDGTSTPYWMAVNSWGTGWGQQGFFQIVKGTDECRIESMGIYFGTVSNYA